MKRLTLIAALFGSIGCATTHQGEVTVLHPRVSGDTASEVWIKTKDMNLPYMEFHHIGYMHPIRSSLLVFRVLLFSSNKEQITPERVTYYLIDDTGKKFTPTLKHRSRVIERHRSTDMDVDVPGQLIRYTNPDGTQEIRRLHHIENVELAGEYYYGFCELEFGSDNMLRPETKSLSLVAESGNRHIVFTWHFTDNPEAVTDDIDHRPTKDQQLQKNPPLMLGQPPEPWYHIEDNGGTPWLPTRPY